jgi:hypothetical protein
MTRHITIFLLVALLPFAASAQSNCDARAEAEQNRITREFSSQAPSKHDQQAYMVWSKNLHTALSGVASRHEDCIRSSRAATSPATASKIDECIARINRRTDEFEKKYRGRNLTTQEQAMRRAEEQRLIDERMTCTSRASR